MRKMDSEIVVVGSISTDYLTKIPCFPRAGQTVFGHSLTIGFGGKGSNQCIAAERLGATTSFVGRVGEDQVGDNCIEAFKKTNVNIDHLKRTPNAQTAIALITVDDNGENSIVVISGANKLLTEGDVEAASDAIKKAKVLVCQNEVTPEATRAALILAKKNGVTTLMNAGPGIPDLDPLIIQNSDILCVNETEAEVLTGLKVTSIASAEEAGKAMVLQGCGGALLTLGAQGALWVTKEECQHVTTEKVKAVDTTGAGDAFLGALAYYIARHPSLPFKEKMRRSCSVATTSVLKPGTWDSYPYRNQLDPELLV